jgi:hypothetical protein
MLRLDSLPFNSREVKLGNYHALYGIQQPLNMTWSGDTQEKPNNGREKRDDGIPTAGATEARTTVDRASMSLSRGFSELSLKIAHCKCGAAIGCRQVLHSVRIPFMEVD